MDEYYELKEHLFLPSEKKIYTIIGNTDEYWIDLNLEYCSCDYFYYKSLSTGKNCQHLEALKYNKIKTIDTIIFQDREYPVIIKAIIQDILNKI